MTAVNNELPLIEKRRIDHTVFVYRDGDAVKVKLVDASREGEFVDGTRSIKESTETPGCYLVPFVDGGVTPSPAEEVAYIVRHLPMTVERKDVTRSTKKRTKFYELTSAVFPEKDAHLVGLLKSSPIDAGFETEPWSLIIKQAIADAREHDMFDTSPADNLFATA